MLLLLLFYSFNKTSFEKSFEGPFGLEALRSYSNTGTLRHCPKDKAIKINEVLLPRDSNSIFINRDILDVVESEKGI